MKKVLILIPVFGFALLLSACNSVSQPAVPRTSPALEKALQEAIDKQNAPQTDEEVMEEGDIAADDVVLELDEALENLANELDDVVTEAADAPTGETAPEADAAIPTTETEEAVIAEGETAPEADPTAPATDTEGQIDDGAVDENELLDQPIIIE